MARHSLGGLRSSESVAAPDRIIMRLSPFQTWILRQALSVPGGWYRLPPIRAAINSAQRLRTRGILDTRAEGTEVRYRPLALAVVAEANYYGPIVATGRTKRRAADQYS